uniref:Gamma-synuclein n=1 Tax=Sinocyclocheilus grahami TaxID=75366 RepID=A0A672R7H8_SINGR
NHLFMKESWGKHVSGIAITRMALPLFIWNFYLVFLYQSAISEERIMFVSGNKTKEGMVSGVNTVAQRTTDQANIVGETAVGSTNEVGQKTVEGLENVAICLWVGVGCVGGTLLLRRIGKAADQCYFSIIYEYLDFCFHLNFSLF